MQRAFFCNSGAEANEAAIKIVRMAAPFAPFPEELRATTDKLEASLAELRDAFPTRIEVEKTLDGSAIRII